MLSHRLISTIVAGILVLLLAACAPASPAPPIPPTAPVSPLATEPAAGVQPESTLSAQQSPLATPELAAPATVEAPSAGKGSLAGRLIDFNTNAPMTNQNLSLPAVVCPPGVEEEAEKRAECVYLIDEAFDPSVVTDGGGRFVFHDIEVGDYVLLVGNRITRYTVLSNEFNEPLIWRVEADKVVELGDLVVDLPE